MKAQRAQQHTVSGTSENSSAADDNQQQRASEQRDKNELAIAFGKFCLDLAKLTYGGVFLSAIMQINYDMSKAIKYGAIAIILLAILGFLFIRIGNNKKKL